jgi:NADH:ubiquinone oxidoreductase subunit K
MPTSVPPIYPIALQHGLVLGAALFAIGMAGALTKRNAITVLMCVELMLNGVIVTFVSFARHAASTDLVGQVFSIFIMTVAAAEAAVGLAIVISLFRHRESLNPDSFASLKW